VEDTRNSLEGVALGDLEKEAGLKE
jgi:hypothetical protein